MMLQTPWSGKSACGGRMSLRLSSQSLICSNRLYSNRLMRQISQRRNGLKILGAALSRHKLSNCFGSEGAAFPSGESVECRRHQMELTSSVGYLYQDHVHLAVYVTSSCLRE